MVGTMWDWDDMKGLTVFMAIMARLAGPAISSIVSTGLGWFGWTLILCCSHWSPRLWDVLQWEVKPVDAEFEDDAMLPRFMGYGLTQLNGCNISVECVKREVEITWNYMLWFDLSLDGEQLQSTLCQAYVPTGHEDIQKARGRVSGIKWFQTGIWCAWDFQWICSCFGYTFGYVLFVSALILSLFNAASEIVAGKERFDREKKALHFVQRYTGLLAGQSPKKAPPKLRGLKNCMAFRMVVPTDVWNFFCGSNCHCNFSYLLGKLCH